LFTIKFSSPAEHSQFFDPASDKYFAISSVTVNAQSDSLMDFYIFMVDGVDGIDRPPGMLSLTSMILYNSYAVTADTSRTAYISNYWNTNSATSGKGY
jgi:hypothetical protein